MDALEVLRHIVVWIHITGFAILFGAWLVEAVARRNRMVPLMNIGLGIAFIAGLILAAPWGIEYELNYVKLGVKLLVAIAIGACIGIGAARQRRGDGAPPAGLFWSVGVLTLLNSAIAVIWR